MRGSVAIGYPWPSRQTNLVLNEMEVLRMNQRQLANRRGVSEACLERWRPEGIGPQVQKLRGRVMYRQVDVEAFEESCLRQSTSSPKAIQKIRSVSSV